MPPFEFVAPQLVNRKCANEVTHASKRYAARSSTSRNAKSSACAESPARRLNEVQKSANGRQGLGPAWRHLGMRPPALVQARFFAIAPRESAAASPRRGQPAPAPIVPPAAPRWPVSAGRAPCRSTDAARRAATAATTAARGLPAIGNRAAPASRASPVARRNLGPADRPMAAATPSGPRANGDLSRTSRSPAAWVAIVAARSAVPINDFAVNACHHVALTFCRTNFQYERLYSGPITLRAT